MGISLVPESGSGKKKEIKELVESIDIDSDQITEEDEKKFEEKSEIILNNLRRVFGQKKEEGGERIESLHEAIVQITSGNEGVEPMDVYVWIAEGDVEKAQRFFAHGEELSAEKLKQPTLSPEEFIKKIEEIKPSDIEISELKHFFEIIKGIDDEKVEHELGRILHERMDEIKEFGEESTATIVKVMISGVKSLGNHNPSIESLVFNEEDMKSKVISGYGEEVQGKTPEEREILSTAEGKITGLTVFLSLNHNDVPEMKEHYYSAIKTLYEANRRTDGYILKLVYNNDREREEVEEFLEKGGVDKSEFGQKILFVKAGDIDSNERYDIWARDGAVRRGDGTIVEPYDWFSNGSGNAYDSLVPTEGTDIQQSELIFEGGNMRSTDTYLFVGYDSIYFTLQKVKGRWPGYPAGASKMTAEGFAELTDFKSTTPQDIEHVVDLFEKEFGKKVVVVGLEKNENGEYETATQVQRHFHIDMIMTPLGGKDVLLADVEGDRHIALIERQLVAQGFNKTKVPIEIISDEETEYYLTYNNVLLESYEEKGKEIKRVYLPQYYGESPKDLKKLNEEASFVYKKLGFEVIPIPLSIEIAKEKGSLNCFVFEDRTK